MVESGIANFEQAQQEAHELMMQNKHLECSDMLNEIEEAAKKGTLKNQAGQKVALSS